MKNVIIIGATSAIAEATARVLAQQGDNLYILARNEQRLKSISEDLKIRGAARVAYNQVDVNIFEDHQFLINTAFETLGKVDVVLIAHGTLPDQRACEINCNLALEEINTNAISTILLLTHVANKLEVQKSGTIAVITSVAGDRGRQSNYVYGSAKGMVSIFLQGLRNRLNRSGVVVIDIKPGFVDTPMTEGFKKGPLWANPEKIAESIVLAIKKEKTVAYLPWFWAYIMLAIKHIPESIFKRMKL